MSRETDGVLARAASAGDGLAHLAAFQALVLERSHDLITVIDPAGAIVYASPSWRGRGWDPDELAGRTLLDFVHPDDHAVEEAFAGADAGGVTMRLRTAGGQWSWYESSGAPIVDEGGAISYVVVTARDVSEREELRVRVSEVDPLYRIADAIARATTLDDLLAEAIDTLLTATGADRAAALVADDAGAMRYRAWRGLSDAYRTATDGHSPWTPDVVDPEPVLVPRIADAGFDAELERAVRDEGIEALAFVPLVNSGRLVGKCTLYHDRAHEWGDAELLLASRIANHLASATVRTHAQEALRASSDQLQTIMRTVDEGIVVQAPTGGLVYANDAAARLVGFPTAAAFLAAPQHEVLAQFEILDRERRPLEDEELPGRRALRGETSEQTVCYRIVSTGEERWSIVRANPVYDAAGKAVLSVSVIRDITASMAAEQRVRFLALASELLNETLDYEQTLAAIAEMAVPTLAGQVVIDLFEDDGSIRCVAAAHVDPGKREQLRELRRRYPPTALDHPVQRAIRTGEPVYIADVQEHVDEMAHDAEHAKAIRELANTSGIVVPLIARGRTLGTIQLGTIP
ncbi:MAG TPA: PAS domain S-box protein, partial [Gaiellaceae bacterium]|nr:PAS domain S-box protein [Gaiellaceae bacterium]